MYGYIQLLIICIMYGIIKKIPVVVNVPVFCT